MSAAGIGQAPDRCRCMKPNQNGCGISEGVLALLFGACYVAPKYLGIPLKQALF